MAPCLCIGYEIALEDKGSSCLWIMKGGEDRAASPCQCSFPRSSCQKLAEKIGRLGPAGKPLMDRAARGSSAGLMWPCRLSEQDCSDPGVSTSLGQGSPPRIGNLHQQGVEDLCSIRTALPIHPCAKCRLCGERLGEDLSLGSRLQENDFQLSPSLKACL